MFKDWKRGIKLLRMKIGRKADFERDFYERVISVIKSNKSDDCFIISERDSIKGLRVTVYDTERGIVLRDYKCRC